MKWSRVEAMGRDVDIDEGVAARFADPLWLIGRQWQLGELDGDDAAQPAVVRFSIREAPLVSYSVRTFGDGASGSSVDLRRPLPTDTPLETLIESAPEPSSGYAGLHRSIRAGQRLARLLSAAGLAKAVAGLRSAFAPSVPGPNAPRLPATGGAAGALLARRGIDGGAIATASEEERSVALTDLSDDDRDKALAIISDWVTAEADAGGDAWRANRFEHKFSVAADDGGTEVVLRADEHQGGRVDWHSFDIDAEASGSAVIADADRSTRRRGGTAIATPVRFAGMPASRWWEFEDGEVNFGDLDAGPGDLARLAVAEFAAVYNDDWFMIPARARRASLLQVESLEVFDTFGQKHTIHPASVIDHELAERVHGDDAGDQRAWRYFELSGDTHGDEARAPWVLLPPSLSTTLHGPDIERVVFVRDEDANLAWAIERLVEGPLGRPVDRASTWSGWSSRTDSEPDNVRETRRYGDEHWRWELETSPPPWWIPMMPERQNAGTEQVRLRRARMATWQQHAPSDVGPKGELLEPSAPFYVYEEEVPRSGATVTRSWQWARWQDGGTHLWLQRRKRNGRGERSSGLEWDVLHDVAGPAPARSRDDTG